MKYLMCNLKSNKTLKEILEYKKAIASINQKNIEFVLFPSSIYLSFFYDTNYQIGAQNISIYNEGSYTGEIFASQLAHLKVSYVLINHCEVKESIESCILKIQNATKEKIRIVFCIGKEIKSIDIFQLQNQIKEIFNKLNRAEMENIILAYEPCWAINSQNTLNPLEIENVCEEIKKFVKYEYNINCPFLYGGSINKENFHNLLKIDKLDGYLIGNCAINPENILCIADKI